MMPQTKEEARLVRYNDNALCPGGIPFKENRCAAEVPDWTGWQSHQCTRKPGKGPDGLYCGTHAKMIFAIIGDLNDPGKRKE